MKREPFLLRQKRMQSFRLKNTILSCIRLVIFKSHDTESQSPAMGFHNPAMDFHNPSTDFQSPRVGLS